MSKPLLCKIFGHKTTAEYTQPKERFIKLFNKYLGEPMWYEQFFHGCVRKNCDLGYMMFRWTRQAARKMLYEEDKELENENG